MGIEIIEGVKAVEKEILIGKIKKRGIVMKKSVKEEKYSIVRTFSAGVWFGKIKELKDSTAIITEARRLWYWSGAASLSELAVSGVKNPSACKFCVVITDPEGVYLPQVIEVLPVSKEAEKNIKEVPEWKS